MAKVWMKAPGGEVREVEDSIDELAPLMKAGWKATSAPPPEKRSSRGREKDGNE